MNKILVVDDNKEITDLIASLLESEGYEVVKAFTGNEAIEKFSNEIVLCILDVMMPGMAVKYVKKFSKKVMFQSYI